MFGKKKAKDKYITSYTLVIATKSDAKFVIDIEYLTDGSLVEEYINSPFKNGEIVTPTLVIPIEDVANYYVIDYVKVRIENEREFNICSNG